MILVIIVKKFILLLLNFIIDIFIYQSLNALGKKLFQEIHSSSFHLMKGISESLKKPLLKIKKEYKNFFNEII